MLGEKSAGRMSNAIRCQAPSFATPALALVTYVSPSPAGPNEPLAIATRICIVGRWGFDWRMSSTSLVAPVGDVVAGPLHRVEHNDAVGRTHQQHRVARTSGALVECD